MNGVTHQFFTFDADVNFNVCQDDTVIFAGTGDDLGVVRSLGMTFVAMGTNQSIQMSECGTDDSLFDVLGKGLQLSFYQPASGGITASDIQVYGFGQDPTGYVHLNPLQTVTITSDMRGGSYLSLGTSLAGGAPIHFNWDSPANLASHIQPAVT